ncbi:MAG: lytic transglycosylase domain-containing protein [Rhodoferax sp.]|nr:lytic transglycosylase domain-containing protein [Rhodoferax sp.]
MLLRPILTSILLLAPLCSGLGLAQAAAPARVKVAQDDVLLEMSQAFRQGDRKRLSALLPRAQGHLLEPWAAYWELRARLDTASASEVREFFRRYAGTYQEDRLRNDWLLVLGQRRDAAGFADELSRYRMNDDREVRCYAVGLAADLPSAEGVSEIRRLWLAQREADEGCQFAAQRLHAAGRLTDQDVWRKARLALENNRTKAARQAVDLVVADAAKTVDEVISSPSRYLAKRVVATGRTREWVTLALVRLAASDPEQAASLLENHWSVHLTPEQRSWAWGAIGRQAAQRLSPEASDHFAKARSSDLGDEHLAWKTRAALRLGRWREVQAAIVSMSPEARKDSTWVYWLARAQLHTAKSESERAEPLRALQSIAGMRGFYEQLAQEELGQKIVLPERPESPTAEEREAARQNPGLQRALAAVALGLRSDGVREWNYTTNLHQRGGMGDRELLAAAELACEREVWDRCINTSERTRSLVDVAQRFPTPHRDAVLSRAQQIGLDPAYVYGLIRQESRFVMDAQSGVGASGLMQVMPPTARWTARKIGLTDFKPHQLTDRDTNIAIGTGYLKLVLDDFAGSMPLAAAAYNAGPSRPRSWRGQSGAPTLEAAIWAENVPFSETRDYVKKVLANTTVYAALLSGQPQSLKARLGQVGPRGGDAPEPLPDLP